MSKTTKKNSETRRSFHSTCMERASLSLDQCLQANKGKPSQDRAFIERFFTALTNDLLQREGSKCRTR